MDIIEQIGAYGGLAAVLGLAVLSALYFSQARDVKRLREWAGRAPERTAEGATADQLARGVVAQPQPKVVQEAQTAPPSVPGAKPATPAAKPVPAAAAAAGAGPATADQKLGAAKPGGPPKPGVPAATPATAKAAGTENGDTEEAEKVAATAATPAGAAAAAAQAGAGAPAAQAATAAPPKPGDGASPPQTGAPTPPPAPGAPGTPGGPGPQSPPRAPGGPTPAPPTPGTPPAGKAPTAPGAPPRPGARREVKLPSQRGAPSPSQTAILPPRDHQPWHQRLLASPRYLVLVVAGVLIVGGAAAFGVVQLTSDDGGGSSSETPLAEGGGGGGDGGGGSDEPQAAPVNPADVTVSVLNGTTIPGLAASIGDQVEANGFVLGNVDNSADQGARNESVVLFAPGGEREAAAVGRKLGIAQREPIDPESQAIAGDASVVVITGTDLTQ